MSSPKSLARIAGAIYLAMFVFAGFAGFARSRTVVAGDAGATASGIRGSQALFRLGYLADLTQITCMLLAGMTLYLLFKEVQASAAAAMVVFVAVAVAIGCLNLLNQYTALTIATGEQYQHAFGRPASDALAMLFTDMYRNGYYISAVFWGLWLLPLGYLVLRSGYLPRLIGVLLLVGGVGYLADVVLRALAPGVESSLSTFFLAPGGVAEFLLAAWLLVMGVKTPDGGGSPASSIRTPTAVR